MSDSNKKLEEVHSKVSSLGFWDYCPVEILLLVFGKLDTTSLGCCLAVNSRWKEIAIASCEKRGLWQELAVDGLVNHGVALHTKSTLSWKEVFYNSMLWNKVQHASITKRHEKDTLAVKVMHVYKDNIIVVSEMVEFYNVENFELVNTLCVLCDDFQETDDIVLVANSLNGVEHKLTLFHKFDGKRDYQYIEDHLYHDHIYTLSCNIDHCSRWILYNDSCYAVDRKQVLWKAHCSIQNWRWELKSLAKYYGCHSIRNTEEGPLDIIHVIDEGVYVSLSWGDLIEVNHNRSAFQKVRESSIPTYYSTGPNILKTPSSTKGKIDGFSALINVPVASGFLEEFRDYSKLHFHYDDPEMTCAMQHGDVVILGFSDGQVEIQSLKKRIHQREFPATAVKLNVTDFDDNGIEDPAIRGLEVYELKNMHMLFISTSSKIYQLLFKYPENLIES